MRRWKTKAAWQLWAAQEHVQEQEQEQGHSLG